MRAGVEAGVDRRGAIPKRSYLRPNVDPVAG
jgi:hypothetical protein